MATSFQLDADRLQKLAARVLSAEVQVPEAAVFRDVSAELGDAEVEQVFTDLVPGVRGFFFRGKPDQPALAYVVSAYRDGLRAFCGTPVHTHLRSLLRLVVHRGKQMGREAEADLREVAEGFMDCQAVQARTIERVGLRMCGAAPDFKGLVTKLLGEYKTFAIRCLAEDRLAQGLANDYDKVHTHYENRLTADLGQHLGLDADLVRLAALDGHAARRFEPLVDDEAEAAAARCRELFDMREVLHAFVAEVNSFNEDSLPESLPRLFLDWVDKNVADKHVVLDQDTCSRTAIDAAFALHVFEKLFCGDAIERADERCDVECATIDDAECAAQVAAPVFEASDIAKALARAGFETQVVPWGGWPRLSKNAHAIV